MQPLQQIIALRRSSKFKFVSMFLRLNNRRLLIQGDIEKKRTKPSKWILKREQKQLNTNVIKTNSISAFRKKQHI